MHSLIIHMDSSTERRANVDRLLCALPKAEVIAAIDGRGPAIQTRTTTKPGNLHTPTYPFLLKSGEIGCFLSHRSCWQKIVDMGWDAAIIAEDDLNIAPEILARVLRCIAEHAATDRFIRMPPKDREPVTTPIDTIEGCALFAPRVIGLQTTFQVVGRNAALRLLAASEILDRPVDTFLQMHWITGQPILTLLPNGVFEQNFPVSGSTIQQKTPGLIPTLRRDVLRARYRAAVRRRPQKIIP